MHLPVCLTADPIHELIGDEYREELQRAGISVQAGDVNPRLGLKNYTPGERSPF